MKNISTIPELRAHVQHWRANKQTIAFVPTMGNLHAGHIKLVELALTVADQVVVSIFVNPLQFGVNEDYNKYPRTLEADCEKLMQVMTLRQTDADVLFTPTVSMMYPIAKEACTRVEVPKFSDILCGEYRPGHFVGVATVVAKLFNLVQPDKALFGQKDYQQLQIIKRMVADLFMPIEIIGVPTVREADGLAMSSRNGYLSQNERAIAPQLFQEIDLIKKKIETGGQDFAGLERQALTRLTGVGFIPDYVAVRCANTLEKPTTTDRELVVLVAARLGHTRLIDNVLVKIM